MSLTLKKTFTILFICTFLLSGVSTPLSVLAARAAGATPPPRLPDQMLAELAANGARIATHSQTGYVRFIGAAPESPVAQPADLPSPATQLQAAKNLIQYYGVLFGLTKPGQELVVEHSRTVEGGRGVTRFQQVYQGIPVLGGELMLQTDSKYQMLAALGEVLPDISISPTPAMDPATASQTALDLVSKAYQINRSRLTATDPELWIYNPVLIGPGDGPTRLVWRIEVKPVDLFPLRELVLVDAQTGSVALHFNQVDFALNRYTYTANNLTTLPGTLVCNESNPTCSGGDADAVAAHQFAGATYNFYYTYHSRDSIDNAGMALKSTVHYDSNYANAFWNGSQMVYGDGYAFPRADDVVAHELSHGVTENESNLLYYYQAGAINESLSDVWGEFVDLTDGAGNDTSSVRWLLGEDIPVLGAIRNMKNPPAYSNPDKMTSSYYDFDLGWTDNGGVHTNSGINNKAAYLMTDGGTFNGYTISGLGITKVAKIYYEVQTNLLVSGSDYKDLYDALYQGCLNLVGTSGITTADCQQVRNATLAVEMNLQPAAGYNPDAEVCPSGSTPVNAFYDTFESGFSNWSLAPNPGTMWMTNDPYGPFTHSGTKVLYGFNAATSSDSTAAMVSGVVLPANSYLHFFHSYDLENHYDGGVVEYSANGGAWTDGGSLINSGATYNSAIYPWSNRNAFSNYSNGYVSTRLNLSSLAGQNVKFRFRLYTDSSGQVFGWWVDDVRIYTCSSGQPSVMFSASTYNLNENGGSATITANLSSASSQTVTVNYATSNGSAIAGSDYTTTSGTLTFAPGQTSKTFSIPITSDTLDETDETVQLTLSSPVNATLGTPSSATLTILDDDATPTVQFSAAAYSVNENGGSVTISASLSAASGKTVTVNYATSNGTATAGSDYTSSSGTLSFAPGYTSKTFAVTITNDTLDELDETVQIALSNPANATLGSPSSATLTILDDEIGPLLNVSKTGIGSGIVSSTPAGISCGADCTEYYTTGTVVTLTVVVDTGSTFTSWSGDCSGAGQCVLTMSQARSVTANITHDPYLPSVTTEIHNASHVPIISANVSTVVHAKATVSGSAGTPGGTASFTVFSNSTCSGTGASAGTVALVNGVADPSNTVTLTASGLSFQAHYNGSSSYTAADGACQTLAASKLSAATQISSSSNPSKVGQSVTFTTQVRSGAMAPTGVVTITVDGAAVPLTLAPSGIATYTTSSLAAGNHTIRAYYSGDSNFNPGTSSQLIQSVRVQYYLPMITKQRQTSVFSLPPAAGILSKGAARHFWLASGNDGAVNIHPGHLT